MLLFPQWWHNTMFVMLKTTFKVFASCCDNKHLGLDVKQPFWISDWNEISRFNWWEFWLNLISLVWFLCNAHNEALLKPSSSLKRVGLKGEWERRERGGGGGGPEKERAGEKEGYERRGIDSHYRITVSILLLSLPGRCKTDRDSVFLWPAERRVCQDWEPANPRLCHPARGNGHCRYTVRRSKCPSLFCPSTSGCMCLITIVFSYKCVSPI